VESRVKWHLDLGELGERGWFGTLSVAEKFGGVGFRYVERRQTIAALAGRGFLEEQRLVLREVRGNLLAVAGEAASLFCCLGRCGHDLPYCKCTNVLFWRIAVMSSHSSNEWLR
jgi:hypothetical protein